MHAPEVGGPRAALIEAMARGALVLYLDTVENREVCGDAGIAYSNQDELAGYMADALRMSDAERQVYRDRALARVREHYDWDAVASQYESLLGGLIRAGLRK